MTSYHFFVKYDYQSFNSTFDVNPIKQFLQFNDVLPMFKNCGTKAKKTHIEQKLENDLQLCTRFINSDYIYVPYSVNLVSSQLNHTALKNCAEAIIKGITETNSINDHLVSQIISHLLYEVPMPLCDTKLSFYLPLHSSPIEIYGNQSKTMSKIDVSILFKYFSIENIITILHLLMTEEKLLFIAEKCSLLTEVTEAFISLLYPFRWIHTYIPVVSEEFIKYLQSFMAFIMGIEKSLFITAKDIFDNDQIYLIYIEENHIDLSTNKKPKKLSKRNITAGLSEIPEELSIELVHQLKLLKASRIQIKTISTEVIFNS